jgi:hypothetical protein
MKLGDRFRNSPILCFEGNAIDRAEDLADIVLAVSKTHYVWGYAFPVNKGKVPELPSVSIWEKREDIVDFIRTQGQCCNIAFIVFGKLLSPND